jgi:predicted kinase
MCPIHLIEGPVGAGKSTFARRLAQQLPGVHLALDEWFVRLYSPDRPNTDFVNWYLQRKERLLGLIWAHAKNLASANVNPILELGLIQRQARHDFYEQARREGVRLHVHLLDAPEDVRWERVEHRNESKGETFSMAVPRHIFEVANSMWEPPDEDELKAQEIEVVSVAKSDA